MSALSRPLRVLAWPAFKNRSVQPYNALLYEAVARAGAHVDELTAASARLRADIVHLHWPERFCSRRSPEAQAKSALLLAFLRWMRSRGSKVVWTAHNLRAHDPRHPTLERWFWRQFIPNVDGAIALSASGRSEAIALHPALADRPFATIAHGEYRSAYGAPPAREAARAAWGAEPEHRLLAFVGRILPYKGLPTLLRAFTGATDPRLRLVIAGPCPDRELRAELQQLAETDPRMRLRLEHLTDAALVQLVAAADLITLPYRQILNSGPALLALSYDRPVLVPALGAMEELRAVAGGQWVRTFVPPLSSPILEEAIAWSSAPRARVDLAPFDWPRIGQQTVELYRATLQR